MNYLKKSIQYALDFMPGLIEKADSGLIAEPLLQLIKDIYQSKLQQEPFRPIAELVSEIVLPLSDEEREILTTIENSQRKQKDYLEIMSGISSSQLEIIIQKIKDFWA